MKLLIDEALHDDVAHRLQEAGHDVAHVRLRGLAGHTDDEVMALAVEEDRVLVTTDAGGIGDGADRVDSWRFRVPHPSLLSVITECGSSCWRSCPVLTSIADVASQRAMRGSSGRVTDHGYPPLPEFEEPRTSPRSRPDLAERFPLVLTCAKSLHFCETQHRNLPSLRSRVPDPQVELHPDTAAQRGIAAGDWVVVETPHGSVRARAKFDPRLDPQVVCGQHGWWQGCAELDLPGYDPFGPDSANLNLVLRQQPSDPISGSSPLRASVCNVAALVGAGSEPVTGTA